MLVSLNGTAMALRAGLGDGGVSGEIMWLLMLMRLGMYTVRDEDENERVEGEEWNG